MGQVLSIFELQSTSMLLNEQAREYLREQDRLSSTGQQGVKDAQVF